MTVYDSPYTSGNLEAFARPRKVAGIEDKTATFVGSGIASLAGAVFLIRDAHMKGDKITILEQDPIPGGALDGAALPGPAGAQKWTPAGFVIRGGRELEDHYECLWDLFRSIPSLDHTNEDGFDDVSVLDEFYWLNKDDPNMNYCRLTINQGKNAETQDRFNLTDDSEDDIQRIFMATPESLGDVTIDNFFGAEFFESEFWMYWQTMFGFESWHSALEMKLYLHRFIHHIDGLANLSAIKFTKYNQYESFVMPLIAWLKKRNVNFQYGTKVTDVEFNDDNTVLTRVVWDKDGEKGGKDLGENDLLFITNGSIVENSDNGTHTTPAKLKTGPAPAWELWKRIAARSDTGLFGHPEKFCGNIPESKWMSCTVTTQDKRVIDLIAKVTERDVFSGRVVTGGIITAQDSTWRLSWTVSRQPHFKSQLPDQVVIWVYALFVNANGDYVPKSMEDSTGEEITREWLYHAGAPTEEIDDMAAHCNAIPTMMPYITSLFMKRKDGDRVKVIPDGSKNYHFLGQFAETSSRDCIFTTEYSVRTAMEAVYFRLGLERGVPEVFASTYDMRFLLAGMLAIRDDKPLKLPGPQFITDFVCRKLANTWPGQLLNKYGLLGTKTAGLPSKRKAAALQHPLSTLPPQAATAKKPRGASSRS